MGLVDGGTAARSGRGGCGPGNGGCDGDLQHGKLRLGMLGGLFCWLLFGFLAGVLVLLGGISGCMFCGLCMDLLCLLFCYVEFIC